MLKLSLEFVDIHTHILPGVDDGSSSLEETKEMLIKQVKEGVHTIIATPHYRSGMKQDITSLNEKLKVIQELASSISPELKILLGNELFYSDSIIDDLKEKRALTIADTKYVLVEFRIQESFDILFKGLGDLIRAGYAPILAHVERYQCLKKSEDRIMDLIELGVYLQMNTDSLLGGIFHMESKYHRNLIKNGFIHFLSSDCHDKKMRTPLLNSAIVNLKKHISQGMMEEILYHNPTKLLQNKFI